MYYLALQNTYDEVQCALMNGEDLIDQVSLSKLHASASLINELNELLSRNNQSITDMKFIAANVGPGPFTTLRVVITTVNGLSFAQKIPLIGVNALDAAAREWDASLEPTAILLNAFGDDVYTLLIKDDAQLLYGSYSIETVVQTVKKLETPVRFLGNGTTLHQTTLQNELGQLAIIPESIPPYCSLQTIALMGYEKWKQSAGKTMQLEPVYLKQHPAAY